MATRPKVEITEEQAHRLVVILIQKGRGTIEECWVYVEEHFDVIRQEGAA